MSTFSVFGLSYGRSGGAFGAEEGQTPKFDPLPRNEKLCGKQKFPRGDPSKKRVSIFFTKLLHRPGPLS